MKGLVRFWATADQSGRKAMELIFADTYCVSSAVLGPFTNNTIIKLIEY